MQSLSKVRKHVNYLSILPYNGENFRTISLNRYIFLDSMSFLQSSLTTLTDNLKASNHDYGILTQSTLVQKNNAISNKKLKMMLQKGIFPYSFW